MMQGEYSVYDKAMTDSNTEADARGEMDKGAFGKLYT